MRSEAPSFWPFWVFIVFGVVLAVLSCLKSMQLWVPEIAALEGWLGGDKWMHFKLSFVLSLLGLMATRCVLPSWSVLPRVSVTLFFLTLMLALDEFLQQFSDSRHFDVDDLYAGSVGLVTGAALYVFSALLRRSLQGLLPGKS